MAVGAALAVLASGCGSATAQGAGALGHDAAHCQRTIGREGQRLEKATLTAWRRCLDGMLLGQGCDTARRDQDLAAATSRFGTQVVADCTSSLLFDTPPAGIGFASSCDLAPGPSGPPEAQCQALPVLDGAELAACLSCWKRTATLGLLRGLYPCLGAEPPAGMALACGIPPSTCPTSATEVGCARRTAKVGIKMILTREKALEQCLDRVRGGTSGGPCPDGRAAALIAAAARRAEKQIGRCHALPPWWDVCPADATPPCDEAITTIPSLAECIEDSADTLADRLVCQQYPGAGLDGIACSAPPPTTSTTIVPPPTTSTSTSSTSTTTVTAPSSTSTTTLPPDPSTVAPPVDPTVATTVGAATAFLYTGATPIQTGVVPGAIDPIRAAVLKGRVMLAGGGVLPGVTVAILDHPELGRTLTRADGEFDLAVNGGGPLTVTFAKPAFLSAQRTVEVPADDYVRLPEVRLVSLVDSPAQTIDLSSPALVQVARGQPETDASGTRQATVLFPHGTTATMTLPGGGAQPVTVLNVRATEYTVDTKGGPAAMPAELPANSGYTYAVELSIDEALAAGATSVVFNQPVPFYVENFLGFAVGSPVPAGSYDRLRGVWVPSDNGRVIAIVSATGGVADVDADGDGQPDAPSVLAALDITDPERQALASLYPAPYPKTFWRVPIPHFTAWDCNWPHTFDPGAVPPDEPPPEEDQDDDEDCHVVGSILECQNQTLGESLPITGTPFRLHYQSDRQRGRRSRRTLDVSVIGPTIPPGLKRIEVETSVAGQTTTQVVAVPGPQHVSVTWDGRDAYGRLVQGAQPVAVRIDYVYDAVYANPAAGAQAFGRYGTPAAGAVPMRREAPLSQHHRAHVVAWDGRGLGLGGWTLSVHHVYDRRGKRLYLGDGTRRAAETIGPVIAPVAGTGIPGYAGENVLARFAGLTAVAGLAFGPDGALYVADDTRIRRIGTDGIITTVAGTGEFDSTGDGGPALAAAIFPGHLAFGPDASLYFVDRLRNGLRRIDPAGIVTAFAGDGTAGTLFTGEGLPATQASIPRVLTGVAVGTDGTVYLSHADENFDRGLRQVGTDGRITTVAPAAAGGLVNGFASQVGVTGPFGLARGLDGDLLVAEGYSASVRRLRRDGRLLTIAGGNGFGSDGDGGPATSAQLAFPLAVAVDAQGNVFVGDSGRIRVVDTTGTINTLAGTDDPEAPIDDGFPARRTALPSTGSALAAGPYGSVYFGDGARVRKVAPPFRGLSLAEDVIPSRDGRELFVLNGAGRHARTLDGRTAGVKYQLAYDAAGRLLSVADAGGRVTSVVRSSSGAPLAIIAPGGQQTTLTLDANGYLATVTNPAGETTTLHYTNEGLLDDLEDAAHRHTVFGYESDGRLRVETDAAGGSQSFARLSGGPNRQVTRTTGLSHTTSYAVATPASGDRHRVNVFPSGTSATADVRLDGTRTTTVADGTQVDRTDGADPQFGMARPTVSTMLRTPGGLTATRTESRTATLADPLDPLSMTSATETVTMNGREATRTYDASARTQTDTTPAGRVVTTTLDAAGRVASVAANGLAAVSIGRNALGLVSSLTQGSGPDARTVTITYDAKQRPSVIQDTSGRSVGFGYDGADRVTSQTLPDGRVIGFGYDATGNLTAVIPPGRPAHTFTYTPVDLEHDYTAPDAGTGPAVTTYTYNLDRQLTAITRPGDAPGSPSVTLGYDAAGRLASRTAAADTVTFGYHPTAGTLRTVTSTAGGTVTYGYDGALLTSTTWSGGPVTGSVTRTYDADLRLASTRVGTGPAIPLQYDADGLLTQAGNLTLTRDPQTGLVTGTSVGGVTDSRTYNAFGELTTYTTTGPGGFSHQVTLIRDPVGRIIQQDETIGATSHTTTYGYDLAGRLETVTRNGTTITYAYDGNGNRLSRTVAGGTTETGTYDAQDRLVTYAGATYTYTAAGELATKTVGTQVTRYRYDALGNLRTVVLPDGTLIEYVVDGENRRIGKEVNGVLVQGFVWEDGLRVAAEVDASGNVVARFVYGTRVNVPEYMVKEGHTYRIVTDQLGSVRFVLDAGDGTEVQKMEFDEYGRVLRDTNQGFQPFGFAGGLYDAGTALVRYGVRDYESIAGRWTMTDPISFVGGDANLRAYALSDPVNRTDDDGQVAPLAVAAIVAAIVAVDAVINAEFLRDPCTGQAIVRIPPPSMFQRGLAIPFLFGVDIPFFSIDTPFGPIGVPSLPVLTIDPSATGVL